MQVEQGKYGATKDVYFELFEVDGIDLRTDWTPAAADCQVSVDGAAYSNSDNIAVVAPTGSGTYKVVLSATEMTGKVALIKLVDAATKVFLDKTIKVETYGHASALHPFDLGTALASQTVGTCTTNTDLVTAAVIADAVWDEVVTAHAGASSAGLYLTSLYQSIVTRIAQCGDAGGASTIDLDAGASAVADYYKGQLVAIVAGTGIGQSRTCVSYDETTKIATVHPAWATPPDGDSYFAILNTGSTVVVDWAEGGRLDLLLDAIKAVTDWQRACSGTVVVNNPGTDTIFDLTATVGTLSTNNNSCDNMQISFFDVSGGVYETRKVNTFVGASGRVTVDKALAFPVDDGVDTFILWNKYSPTAAAGGGATAQEVHEYDVSGITTKGLAGYEIQKSGTSSIYNE
jgi:hypothetical protein